MFVDEAEPVLEEARVERLREAAREAGVTTFFTGIPCIWGHITTRYVANSQCTSCKTMFGARKTEGKGKRYSPNKQRYARNLDSPFGMAAGKKSVLAY
jgi:hypothetical protein